MSFYLTLGALAGSMFVYTVSRPGENGELSALHRWFRKLEDFGTEWETRNHLMTAALEQASHDKHLFLYAEPSKHIELKYPEYVASIPPTRPAPPDLRREIDGLSRRGDASRVGLGGRLSMAPAMSILASFRSVRCSLTT